MKKLVVGILVAVLALALLAPVALAKSDKDKPLPATDVDLVKKVTLRGKPIGGGKPVKQAATGILGAQCEGNRYAIIIGISDYPDTANDLQYCDDDAQDMYYALTSLYDYDERKVYLLTDREATYDAIQGAINAVKNQAVAGDEVVFFFSGHGAKGRANDGDNEGIDEAIVTHDGNNLVYLWDGQLRDWFSGFQTSRIIFIFDSCLAGGMTDLKASGRVINMACSESGVSYEGDAWGNGQFTYYFVDQGMLEGYADKYDSIPDDADVTIEEAFDYAVANCEMQKPVISDSFENDLLP